MENELKENRISTEEVENEEENTKRMENEDKEIDVQFTDKNEEKHDILNIDYSDYDNLKKDIYNRVNVMINYYLFSNNYFRDLIDFFELFNKILFEKVNNTIDNNKNFLKFFNEIMNSYSNFGNSFNKINAYVASPKNDILQDIEIPNFIQKTQEGIAQNFSNFSAVIQQSIISKGPFQKVKEFYSRLSKIEKEINKKLSKLNTEFNKFIKKFNEKYGKMFDSLKRAYEENLEENIIMLLKKYEFFLIELDIYDSLNDLFGSLNLYLQSYKENLSRIKNLIQDYVNLVKESLDLYLKENSKIFHINISDTMDYVNEFYNNIRPENIQKMFSFKKLVAEEETYKQLNQFFDHYYANLITYKMLITENLRKDTLQFLDKFNNVDDLIDLCILNNPNLLGSNYYDENYSLITFKRTLRRDPSLFSKWKDCVFVITAQNSLILFDEIIRKNNFVEKFDLKKTKLIRRKSKVTQFEVSENRKGLIFNSNTKELLDAIEENNLKEIEDFIKTLGLNKESINENN